MVLAGLNAKEIIINQLLQEAPSADKRDEYAQKLRDINDAKNKIMSEKGSDTPPVSFLLAEEIDIINNIDSAYGYLPALPERELTLAEKDAFEKEVINHIPKALSMFDSEAKAILVQYLQANVKLDFSAVLSRAKAKEFLDQAIENYSRGIKAAMANGSSSADKLKALRMASGDFSMFSLLAPIMTMPLSTGIKSEEEFTTIRVSAAALSSKRGISLMCHEVGHMISKLVLGKHQDKIRVNPEMINTLTAIRRDLKERHPTLSEQHVEEDWADLVSARATQENFACDLMKLAELRGNIGLIDQDLTDEHSSPLFRVLNIHRLQLNVMPAQCGLLLFP